ncbi:MAG: Nif3-like dinuclear metal center hexameric protein [Jiangellales bacterium]
MLTVGDVVAALEQRYRPSWAEPWDSVGLTCGDPASPVGRVLFAVDPAPAVVAEARECGADLLVTHHPLLLAGVHSVAATTPKGRVVHDLVQHGVALFSAHTNADSADPGVSDALASALGLVDLRPLRPLADALDKVVVFVPHADAQRVLDALASAGAGRIGDYDRCGYVLAGTGTFRPRAGANPTIGTIGEIEQVAETRLEMVVPRDRRAAVVQALRAAHPYEEPAFDLFELAAFDSRRGLGRIGHLPEPETLEDLVGRVAAAVPATVAGVQAGGDPDRVVQAVAVCGGAGDSLLSAAERAGVDAFVTADLRHHPASEALDAGGPALVNVSHWASEWPWLAAASQALVADLGAGGQAVEIRVSEVCTDPWTMHAESLSDELLEADDA